MGKKKIGEIFEKTFEKDFQQITSFLLEFMKFLHENNIGKV